MIYESEGAENESIEKADARQRRADKGTPRLTNRDLVTLTWIGEQYTVRFDTIQKLLGRLAGEGTYEVHEEGKIAERNVRRVIHRWEILGLAKTQKILFDEPSWVWLTSKGLRDMGFSYRLYTPSPVSLNHFHLINELRFRLEDRYGERITWKSERALRAELEDFSAEERKRHHLTDADVTLDGTHIAIEVELTQKSSRRVEGIIRQLAHEYPAIWYFVNNTTESVVKRSMGQYEKKIRVYNLKDVLS